MSSTAPGLSIGPVGVGATGRGGGGKVVRVGAGVTRTVVAVAGTRWFVAAGLVADAGLGEAIAVVAIANAASDPARTVRRVMADPPSGRETRCWRNRWPAGRARLRAVSDALAGDTSV